MTISQSMQAIFDEYKNKIKNSIYNPKTPQETLMARMTAVWFLQSDDTEERRRGEEFIKYTSLTKEEDFMRLKEFANTITAWSQLQICSSHENDKGLFLEYKLLVTTTKGEETVHRHAFYQMHGEHCCYISQKTP